MMKVKITHPIITNSGRLEAGQIVEVPDELGAAWIEQENAVEVKDEVIEVTELVQELPHFIEGLKTKKVKHGDG